MQGQIQGGGCPPPLRDFDGVSKNSEIIIIFIYFVPVPILNYTYIYFALSCTFSIFWYCEITTNPPAPSPSLAKTLNPPLNTGGVNGGCNEVTNY